METTATLRLAVKDEVSAQMKKAREEMEGLQKSTDRTKGVVKDLFRELAGPAAGVGAGAAIGLFVKSSLEAAARLQEMHTLAEVVFEGDFPEAQRQAEGLAASLNRSSSDMLGFKANLALVAEGLGIGGELAQRMSTDLTRLGVEFSKALGGSQEDAMRAITSALEGNTRGLRQYGIVLNDATMSQFARTKGIKEEISELTQAQKALLAYQFLLEKTGSIQEAARRNTGNLRDEMERLSATWTDFLETAGTPLLPVFTSALEGVNGLLAGLGGRIDGLKQELVSLYMLRVNLEEGNAVRIQDGYAVRDYAAPGFKQRNEEMFHQNTQGVKDMSAAAKEGQKDFKQYWDAVGGGGGGGKAEDAADDLEKIKDAMDDLGRAYAGTSRDIGRDLKQLELSHKESMAQIEDSIAGVKDALDDLEKSYAKTIKGLDADEVSVVADQIERVKKLEEELRDLEQTARNENNAGSVSVRTNEKLAEKRAEIAAERAALEQYLASNPGMEGKALSDLGKSDFDKDLERIQERRTEEKERHDERQQELKDEMQKLDQKKMLEEEAYTLQRQQYELTKVALDAFATDYELQMRNIDKVTQETVDSMKGKLDDLKNTISQIDALLQANAAITGGDTLAGRAKARRDERLQTTPDTFLPKFAEGGIVTRPTVALIGEAGPEAVVPLGKGGVAPVTVTIGPVYISKEVDGDALLRRIAREVQLQQQLGV